MLSEKEKKELQCSIKYLFDQIKWSNISDEEIDTILEQTRTNISKRQIT